MTSIQIYAIILLRHIFVCFYNILKEKKKMKLKYFIIPDYITQLSIYSLNDGRKTLLYYCTGHCDFPEIFFDYVVKKTYFSGGILNIYVSIS